MEPIDLLKNIISKISDAELNAALPRAILRLTDEQINTVSFVFWLVYVAETDLNKALSMSWEESKKFFSEEVNQITKKMLQEMIPGKKKIDIENLEYFSDKIKVFEAIFGKNSRVEILYKLRDLRNDISHNRIDNLQYNKESLSLRKTKEKILFDYLKTSTEIDFSKSPVWNNLTENEKKEIEEKLKEIGTPDIIT